MKDLSKQNFEDNWKKAFDGAEIEPSASTWSNIELDIVKGESNSMKKQVLFYKWLAAASVFLVFFFGGLFNYSVTDDKQLSTNIEKVKEASSINGNRKNEVGKNNEIVSNDAKSTNSIESKTRMEIKRKSGELNSIIDLVVAQKNEAQVFPAEKISANKVSNFSKPYSGSMLSLSLIKEVPAIVHGKIVLPRLVLPAMPAAFMNSSKKKQTSEDLWASVGFSAGSYNPGNSSAAQSFNSPNSANDALLNSSGYSDPSNVGSTYSAGFAMSKRVFSRWVLQSGVNYINQSVGYTSNYISYSAANQSKVFVAEYADFASTRVTITTPYEINSAIEVVSLPLQTGYLLVDRKIGWQLNTGVAADFFIRNTLTDQSGTAERFSQGTGEKSPYRAVSWAGLLGTELSYKVARQYRISVVPSMRYSVNSVLKSTSGQASNPLVMDIGFRFRYIFK